MVRVPTVAESLAPYTISLKHILLSSFVVSSGTGTITPLVNGTHFNYKPNLLLIAQVHRRRVLCEQRVARPLQRSVDSTASAHSVPFPCLRCHPVLSSPSRRVRGHRPRCLRTHRARRGCPSPCTRLRPCHLQWPIHLDPAQPPQDECTLWSANGSFGPGPEGKCGFGGSRRVVSGDSCSSFSTCGQISIIRFYGPFLACSFKPSWSQQFVRGGFFMVQFGAAYILMLLAMYYKLSCPPSIPLPWVITD